LILTNDYRPNFFAGLKQALSYESVFNYAILFELDSRVFVDFYNNDKAPFALRNVNRPLIERIYPDHLKNLQGTTHTIFVHQQPPRVKIENNKVQAKLVMFLKTAVQALEKSEIKFRSLSYISESSPDYLKDYVNHLFNKREIMMTLNTLMKTQITTPKLMTYEETGFCPMVPLLEKESINLMFFEVNL
jgi:hypothetical protein